MFELYDNVLLDNKRVKLAKNKRLQNLKMKDELCTNMQWNFQSLLPSDSQGFLTNSQLFPGT